MKFGPDTDAVVSTIDSPFVTLKDCVNDLSAINRVVLRRVGSTTQTTLKGKRAQSMATKLMALSGERYHNGWSASSDACKSMKYGTILVSIEDSPE